MDLELMMGLYISRMLDELCVLEGRKDLSYYFDDMLRQSSI
jgi:hypothetical protein